MVAVVRQQTHMQVVLVLVLVLRWALAPVLAPVLAVGSVPALALVLRQVSMRRQRWRRGQLEAAVAAQRLAMGCCPRSC